MANSPAKRDPASLLPLTELWFNILMALVEEPRHGYGIIKEIEERTDHTVSPATGTVYLALQRLEEDGLIRESARRNAEAGAADGRRRRFYELTAFGRKVMTAEAERLARQLAIAIDKRVVKSAGLRGSRA